MSNDVPLLVQFEFEQGTLQFFLAPKVSDHLTDPAKTNGKLDCGRIRLIVIVPLGINIVYRFQSLMQTNKISRVRLFWDGRTVITDTSQKAFDKDQCAEIHSQKYSSNRCHHWSYQM